MVNFSTVWVMIKHWFSDHTQQIVAFAEPAIDAIEKGGGQILKDAALAAVKAMEVSPTTGQNKFAAAFDEVCKVLAAEGIPLLKNSINLAIEMAVAAIRV